MHNSTGDRFNKCFQWAVTAVLMTGVVSGATEAAAYEFDLVARQFDMADGQELDLLRGVALDDHGSVAYTAVAIDDNTQELIGSAMMINGQLTAISGAITDGLTLTEVFAPSVNQMGDLAYVGRYVDRTSGLENTAVILNGQAVIDSGDTATNGLIIDRIEDVALNALGQLAFQATFIDPATNVFFEQGVFLTRAVPEPTSAAIMGLTTLMLATRKRR